MHAILDDLAQLGPHEKLQLVEDLWDSIEQSDIPVMNDELHAELLRRTAWSDAHPGQDITLEHLAEKLGVRL